MGDTKNLSSQEGIAKMKELAESAKICHFVTGLATTPLNSRPMATQEVDDEGNFWFLSKKSSTKNDEIEDDPEVQLFYSNTSISPYLATQRLLKTNPNLKNYGVPLLRPGLLKGKMIRKYRL
jgi:general stress protein 26